MTARKLIEFGDYRLVRVHRGFTAFEVFDGTDWLNVSRWVAPWMHRNKARHYDNVNRNGKVVSMVDSEWISEVFNQLGDALMRAKKQGAKRRKGAK